MTRRCCWHSTRSVCLLLHTFLLSYCIFLYFYFQVKFGQQIERSVQDGHKGMSQALRHAGYDCLVVPPEEGWEHSESGQDLLCSTSPPRAWSLGRLPRWPTLSFGSLNLDGPPPSPPFSPPTPPPLPPPPAPRTALRVRNVSLEHFGGGDEGLANLAEQVVQHVYRNRWLSLSRSVFSSPSSASSLSSSGSVSDCSDCSDSSDWSGPGSMGMGSEGQWETDSDVG